MRARRLLLAAALAAATTACGEEPVPDELWAVPLEATAAPATGAADVPATEAASELVPPPLEEPAGDEADAAAASDDGDDDAGEAAEPAGPAVEELSSQPQVPAGPTDGDIAGFLHEHLADAVASDHRAVDLTGDGARDIVVAALWVGGAVEVAVATWDVAAFEVRGRTGVDGAKRIGDLALPDLDGVEGPEAVLPLRLGGHPAVLVATIAADGAVGTPPACPVDAALPWDLEVGGVQREVELVCAPSDAQDALVWSAADGTFARQAGPRPRPGRDERSDQHSTARSGG